MIIRLAKCLGGKCFRLLIAFFSSSPSREFLLLWSTAPPSAQSDNLNAIRRQVERLYEAGRYSEALPLAERAAELTRARYGEGHANYVSTIAWLAMIYQELDQLDQAEALTRQALN